jgi:hypothetical protein
MGDISKYTDKKWTFEITISSTDVDGDYGDYLHCHNYDHATEDFQDTLKNVFSDIFKTYIDVKVRKGRIDHDGL